MGFMGSVKLPRFTGDLSGAIARIEMPDIEARAIEAGQADNR